MRHSKYWDDFERRLAETSTAVLANELPPVRRVAVFVTEKCNFHCQYCNGSLSGPSMDRKTFIEVLKKYGDRAIIHITGGEPSVVPWLYPFLEESGDKFRFHLNSNAYISPPAKAIRRLKVSLDSHDSNYWDQLVGRKAFDVVVKNIQAAIPKTIVSITYTLTKQNYKNVVDFAKFCGREFPGLYAIFFSVYKGMDPRFLISKQNASLFFSKILPELLPELNDESAALIQETIDKKRRLMQGVRFEQNCSEGICWLSLSERVFSPTGAEYTCSHLYRDGVFMQKPMKTYQCRYGCNQRLVRFNEDAAKKINPPPGSLNGGFGEK